MLSFKLFSVKAKTVVKLFNTITYIIIYIPIFLLVGCNFSPIYKNRDINIAIGDVSISGSEASLYEGLGGFSYNLKRILSNYSDDMGANKLIRDNQKYILDINCNISEEPYIITQDLSTELCKILIKVKYQVKNLNDAKLFDSEFTLIRSYRASQNPYDKIIQMQEQQDTIIEAIANNIFSHSLFKEVNKLQE